MNTKTTLTFDEKERMIIRYCLLTYANQLKDELKHSPSHCIKEESYKDSIGRLIALSDRFKP